MKGINLYSVNQIAAITGYSISTVYEKIKSLQIAPKITIQRINYYDDEAFKLICVALETAQKEKSFTKYYPMKTTETFYIYESKMNFCLN